MAELTPKQEIGRIVDEITTHVIGMDPSPKMVLHEPYRTIISRIEAAFEEELRDYYDVKPKDSNFIITKEALEDTITITNFPCLECGYNYAHNIGAKCPMERFHNAIV